MQEHNWKYFIYKIKIYFYYKTNINYINNKTVFVLKIVVKVKKKTSNQNTL